MLFDGCALGDTSKVKKALDLGADVNAFTYVDSYEDAVAGSCPFDPGWEGEVSMSPLLFTATQTGREVDERKYQDVIRLLMEKGADTSKVLLVSEKTWFWDKDRTDGWSADKKEKKVFSFEKILSDPSMRTALKTDNCSSPRDFCSISNNMVSFLQKLILPSEKVNENTKYPNAVYETKETEKANVRKVSKKKDLQNMNFKQNSR